MGTLYSMMVFLTVSVAALMIPRIMIDCLRLREAVRDGDDGALRALIASQKEWSVRHGLCAVAALAMVALIRFVPAAAPYGELAAPITAYGMMTLTLIFLESFLAQRVESRLVARPTPARSPRHSVH